MKRFHFAAMVVWATLAVPTVLWWKDSIIWLQVMSIYAIFVGHWGAYEAAKVKR